MMELDTTKLISCPYDPLHLIMPRRIQRHLVKCSKQHPHIKLEVCPFNSSHRIKPEDLSTHKIECPDRKAFEKYLSEIDIGPWKKQKQTDIKVPEYKDDESWDDMVGKGGYDPTLATIRVPFCRKIIGATKKEKHEFYRNERKRLQILQDAADGKIVLKEEDLLFAIKKNETLKDEPTAEIKGEPMERLEDYQTESDQTESENETETQSVIIDQSKQPMKTEVSNENIDLMTVKTEFGYEPQEINIPERETTENIIKREVFEEKMAKIVKNEKIDDEIGQLYEKQQRDLQKVIKGLKSKEPNMQDPRLDLPEDGRLRDRSPSPIFKDLDCDPRLRINPFILMKGKENLQDPRLSSILKNDLQNMKKMCEENILKEKESEYQMETKQELVKGEIEEKRRIAEICSDAVMMDIDILDQLIDDVQCSKSVQATKIVTGTLTAASSGDKTSLKTRTRSLSASSKESGEITDDDDEDGIVLIDDTENDIIVISDDDAVVNRSDSRKLKSKALATKDRGGRDYERGRSSTKHHSRDNEKDIRMLSSTYLDEIEQLKKKIKRKSK